MSSSACRCASGDLLGLRLGQRREQLSARSASRRIPAVGREEHVLENAPVRQSQLQNSAIVPSGALSFLFSVSPLITCSACAMVGSLDRSAASQMIPRGPAERRQELRLHLRVGQLQRARPRRIAGERGGRAGHLRHRVQDHLGRQPPHDVLRVVVVVATGSWRSPRSKAGTRSNS